MLLKNPCEIQHRFDEETQNKRIKKRLETNEKKRFEQVFILICNIPTIVTQNWKSTDKGYKQVYTSVDLVFEKRTDAKC